MASHLDNLLRRLPALECCADQIRQAYDLLHAAFAAQHKLLLCGNGGSASDAEHWSGELLKGFVHRRPLSLADRSALPPELADHLQWALPAIPLTGFLSLSSAFANDVRPDLVFAQLVWGLGVPGDVLAALSTSGNSRNVLAAAQVARAKDMPVLALTGRSGGQLKPLADVCICVPEAEPYKVQEYHLPIYHCLSLMLEDAWAQKQ